MDSRPARWIALALTFAGLGLVVLILLIGGSGDPTTDPGDPKRTAGSLRPPGRGTPRPDPHLADELGAIAGAGAEENAHALDGAPATEAKIAAATRRFLEPYLRYELGEPVAPSDLRSSAGAALVDELLSDPPRFPPGLDRHPRLATVTQVAVMQEVSDRPASGRPRATVVVRLDRAGDPEAAAFTLARMPKGRWLVTGVSE